MIGVKRKEDIIAVVEPPNAISSTSDGGQLLQWVSTGYHIVLKFDEEEFMAFELEDSV